MYLWRDQQNARSRYACKNGNTRRTKFYNFCVTWLDGHDSGYDETRPRTRPCRIEGACLSCGAFCSTWTWEATHLKFAWTSQRGVLTNSTFHCVRAVFLFRGFLSPCAHTSIFSWTLFRFYVEIIDITVQGLTQIVYRSVGCTLPLSTAASEVFWVSCE